MFYFEPVTFFMHFFLFFSGGCCLFFCLIFQNGCAVRASDCLSVPPKIPRIGVRISWFSDVTIAVNAPPKMTPNDISMTFQRMINFLNSLMNPFSFIFSYSSSFVFSPANHAFSIISSSRISIQLGMLPSLTAFWHSLRSIQRTASTSDSCRCSFSASTGFV